MKPAVKEKLLNLNRQFYQGFAGSFSQSRHQAQPGVRQIARQVGMHDAVLDLGCGNGTFASALVSEGFRGSYHGGDSSPALLADAESRLSSQDAAKMNFFELDLANPGWDSLLVAKQYDWLVCFAVLHHLPGEDLRQRTVNAFPALLKPGGCAAVSVWQWHNSPKLRERVLPWSEVAIDPDEIDPGDVLLDWRAEDVPGLRYIHTFDEPSLASLADRAGFHLNETFYSDGKSGDLALYQIWQLGSL